jgi:KDO2-lipid IV(A) lauroyltransferase
VSLRARYVCFVLLGTLFELLPERLGTAITQSVAGVLARRPRFQHAALRENLTMALSGGAALQPDVAVLDRYVERALRGYARYWAEGAKLPAIDRSRVSARLRIVEGERHLADAVATDRGVILALPHVGSWEWGGAFLADMGWPMTAVAERLEPPELYDWFARKRVDMGLAIVPLDESAGGTLARVLREGGVVGLLCDRDLQDNGMDVELFGRRTTVPAGPATLALRTGAVLLCTAVYSGPGRDHHVVITPPLDTQRRGKLREDVARVTQDVTDELGWLIRRAPEQWHVLQPIWPAA